MHIHLTHAFTEFCLPARVVLVSGDRSRAHERQVKEKYHHVQQHAKRVAFVAAILLHWSSGTCAAVIVVFLDLKKWFCFLSTKFQHMDLESDATCERKSHTLLLH